MTKALPSQSDEANERSLEAGSAGERGDTKNFTNGSRLVLGACAVIPLGIWVYFTIFSNEPQYQGGSARYWMNYRYVEPRADLKFQEVWQGLGSNAVPFLVRALDNKSPSKRISYESIWRNLPPSCKGWLPNPSPPPHIVRMRAASALGCLGDCAKAAVPSLIRIAETDPEPLLRDTASRSLIRIDPDAARAAGISFLPEALEAKPDSKTGSRKE